MYLKDIPLVQYMAKGMGSRAVDGQLGTNSNAYDHEAKLIVEWIGENPTQIIFDHRKEYREQRHCSADRDKNIGAGKSAG